MPARSSNARESGRQVSLRPYPGATGGAQALSTHTVMWRVSARSCHNGCSAESKCKDNLSRSFLEKSHPVRTEARGEIRQKRGIPRETEPNPFCPMAVIKVSADFDG